MAGDGSRCEMWTRHWRLWSTYLIIEDMVILMFEIKSDWENLVIVVIAQRERKVLERLSPGRKKTSTDFILGRKKRLSGLCSVMWQLEPGSLGWCMRKSSRTQLPCSLLLLHPYLKALILMATKRLLYLQALQLPSKQDIPKGRWCRANAHFTWVCSFLCEKQ